MEKSQHWDVLKTQAVQYRALNAALLVPIPYPRFVVVFLCNKREVKKAI